MRASGSSSTPSTRPRRRRDASRPASTGETVRKSSSTRPPASSEPNVVGPGLGEDVLVPARAQHARARGAGRPSRRRSRRRRRAAAPSSCSAPRTVVSTSRASASTGCVDVERRAGGDDRDRRPLRLAELRAQRVEGVLPVRVDALRAPAALRRREQRAGSRSARRLRARAGSPSGTCRRRSRRRRARSSARASGSRRCRRASRRSSRRRTGRRSRAPPP